MRTVIFHPAPLFRRFGIFLFAVLAFVAAPAQNSQAQGNASPTASPKSDDTVTVRFGEGWFDVEPLPTGPTRWMAATGQTEVVMKRAGTLVTKGRVRSYVPDNSADVLVDDKLVQTIKFTGGDWQELNLSIPLTAGTHRLLLRSRQAGKQPPNDSRVLTLCVENFQARLGP